MNNLVNMNTEDAIEVFKNLNAFRDNPVAFPPRFPEPRQFKEAVSAIAEYVQNSVILTGGDIKILSLIIREVEDEAEIRVAPNPELCNEVLKRFLEKKGK